MGAYFNAFRAALLAYLLATMKEIVKETAEQRMLPESINYGTDRTQAELTEEQVKRFHADGYVIVRELLPRDLVETLYDHRPRSMFPVYLRPVDWFFAWLTASKLSIDAIWSENSLFRGVWLKSPVPSVASQLMEDKSVRLLTDIVYGVVKGARPKYLGLWHKDSTSFDIVERMTANGLSAWIPLIDIDADIHGGSIFMGNKSLVSPECQAQPDDDCSAECVEHLDEVGKAHTFRRGDVLFFTDNTFHRSQPLQLNAQQDDRFALVGRFVQGDSIFTTSSMKMDKQRKNYCNHNLTVGQPLHSPCFPQVFPPKELPELSELFPSLSEQLMGNLMSVLGFGGEEAKA